MAKLQLVVSDTKSKTSKSTVLEGPKAQALIGKSIGEEVDGKLVGVGSVKLRITGGTDKDGIPMRLDIQGGAKKRAILSSGVGFKPKTDGERIRKLIRGRTITEDTFQVNSIIIGGEPERSDKPQDREVSRS